MFKNILNKLNSRFKPTLGVTLKKFLFDHIPQQNLDQMVIVWELGGFTSILERNAVFSLSLNLRGIATHTIICDGSPVACIQRGIEQSEVFADWEKRCGGCRTAMQRKATEYALQHSFVGRYIEPQKKSEFEALAQSISLHNLIEYDFYSVKVGQVAWSSFNRHMKGMAVKVVEISSEHEIILRKYFFAALVNTYAARQIFEVYKPSALLTSHGVYVDYAPAVMLAVKMGIRVLTWSSGYAKTMHYFTIPKSAAQLQLRGMSEAAWLKRKSQTLQKHEQQVLQSFLHDRYFRGKAHDINVSSVPGSPNDLKKVLGITDSTKPIVCLFTHVSWDACFDFASMLFESANEWVVESIKRMIQNTHVTWIIRIHPGDLTDGTVFTTDALIKKEFPILPDHIKIIWSDMPVNSYSVYQLIDAGITIFGTVGIELSALGKPVILAGDAHYARKGFTIDASSRQEYFQHLDNCFSLQKLPAESFGLAQQYAYSYFMQRQIPITVIDQAKGGHWGGLDMSKLNELLPGKNKALDKICQGIIYGTEVIFEEDAFRPVQVSKFDSSLKGDDA